MKLRKVSNKKIKNCFFGIIFILIIIMTIFFINTIGKKLTQNIYSIGVFVIDNVMTDVVNANIKKDIIKNYNINDLIIVNKNNDNFIESIDYNLEKSYELLIDIKVALMQDLEKINKIEIYDAYFKDNRIFLNVPVYNYTNNLLLANLGPKIEVPITFMKTISGNVYTKTYDYGINSLKLELYVSFTSVNDVVVPFKEKQIIKTYELLVASKIIQGNIPSFYNGIYESNSGVIDVNK